MTYLKTKSLMNSTNRILCNWVAITALLLLVLWTDVAHAQGGPSYTIFGATAGLSQNVTYTYHINNLNNVTATSWSSTGASPSNPTPYTQSGQIKANFRWTTNGTKTINLTVTDASGTQSLTLNVYVGPPPTPNTPTVQSTSCGSAVLSVSNSGKPDGVSWYWQGKSSSGTFTNLGSGTTFTANDGSGTYYLRARWNAGDQTWSSSSSSRSVTILSPPSVAGLSVEGGGAYCTGSGEIQLRSNATFQHGVNFDLFRNGTYVARRTANDEQTLGAQYMISFGNRGTGTYTVKVNNTSCSYQQVNGSAIITTKSAGTISIVSTPSPLERCPGDNVVLRAEGGTGYSWSTGSTSNQITVSPTSGSSTVYTVTGLENSCNQTRTAQVLVTGKTVVTSVSITPGTSQRCAGSGTSPFQVQTNPNANANYSWGITPGAGSVSGGTVNWNSGWTGPATVSVTATGQCNSSKTASATVQVNSPDVTGMTLQGSTGCVASESNVVLRMSFPDQNVQTNPFPNNQSYQLVRINGGSETNIGGAKQRGDAVCDGTGCEITFSNVGAGQFNVRATYAGCSKLVTGQPVNVTVTTPEMAYVPNVPEVRNQTICPGPEATLVLPTGSPNTKLYNAATGGVAFPSTSQGNDITVDLGSAPQTGGPFTYYAGLPAGPCINETRIPITVDFYGVPAAPNLPEPDRTACAGDVIQYRVANPNAALTYRWYDNNDYELPGSPGPVLNVDLPLGTHQLYLQAVTTTGCVSPIVPMTATFNALPTVSIDPIRTTVCPQGSPQLAAITDAGNSVQWLDEHGVLLSTAVTPQLSPLASTVSQTVFRLEVTGNGCVNSDEVTVTQVPGDAYQPETSLTKVSNTEYSMNVQNPAVGYTFFWADQTEGASPVPRTVSIPGSYDLMARNTSTGCLAAPAEVDVPDLQPHLGKTLGEQNHVRTFLYKRDASNLTNANDVGQVAQTTQYIDGLGRDVQSVSRQTSVHGLDMVTPMEYNALGRSERNYLPYEANTSDGGSKSNPFDDHHDFYSVNTPARVAGSYYGFAYSEIEKSPLSRVDHQYAPGTSWAGSAGTSQARPVSNLRASNEANEVYQWEIVGGLPETADNVYYPANTLYKSVTIDEEGHQSIEFVDMKGQTLLKKVQLHENGAPAEEWANTYYIYDDYGNLRFVLQPNIFEIGLPSQGLLDPLPAGWVRVIDDIEVNQYDNVSYSFAEDASVTLMPDFEYEPTGSDYFVIQPEQTAFTMVDELTFQYRYDHLNRLIAKKVPGADWVYMVYDRRDRLVLTQDGNQRLEDRWLFTKYDALNRPIMTGQVVDNRPLSDIRAAVAAHGVFSENETTDAVGYSLDQSFPINTTTSDLLTVTYYDDYSFTTNAGWDAENSTWPAQSCGCELSPKGQVTGTQVKNLVDGTWLNSTTHYDNKYRVRQVFAENVHHGIDVTTSEYYFHGLVKSSTTQHNGNDSHTILEEFEYDHADRVTKVHHTIDTGDRVLLADNSYNAIGEVVTKKLHTVGSNLPLQVTDYDYNIRGWLKQINDPGNITADKLFGMELLYNEGPNAQHNGNIGEIRWGTVDKPVVASYGFTYDPMNRLMTADYSGEVGENHDVGNISYDHNGNIFTLNRHGELASGAHGSIDQLSYAYQGNQLTNVNDAIATDIGSNQNFQDGQEGSNTEYEYDPSGNMTVDANKGLEVTYNHLNLPEMVTFTGNSDYIQYGYDAAGMKLRKIASIAGEVKTTDYIGGFHYTNGDLEFLQHAEGRAVADNDWKYEYNLTDHLGNVRVVVGEPDAFTYLATMETENATAEEAVFTNVAETRALNGAANHTAGGDEVARVNNVHPVGPFVALSVRPGDEIDLSVFGYYEPLTPPGDVLPVATLASALAGALDPGAVDLEGSSQFQSKFEQALGSGAIIGIDDATIPRGYLNYMLFDEELNLLNGGFVQVSSAASGALEALSIADITVSEVGYLMAYVSNESDIASFISFDDFTVTHTTNGVKQVQDYYPFGLTFNEWTREPQNNYLYNQGTGETTFRTERQRELGVDMSKYRTYDYALGRWWQIDPLSDKRTQESLSPYHYSFNNPILYSDPLGESGVRPVNGAGIAQAVENRIYKVNRSINKAFDYVKNSEVGKGFRQFGEIVGRAIDCGCLPQVLIDGNNGPVNTAAPEMEQQRETLVIDLETTKETTTNVNIAQTRKFVKTKYDPDAKTPREMFDSKVGDEEAAITRASKEYAAASVKPTKPDSVEIEVTTVFNGDTAFTTTKVPLIE